MSKHTLLRILCILTFLIFLCPFFQMCSNKSLNGFPFKTPATEETVINAVEEITITDSITKNGETKITTRKDTIYTQVLMPENVQKVWKKEKEKAFKKTQKEFTFNVYKLNYETFKEFNYTFLPFNFILLFAVLQFIMANGNKYKSVYILSILNLLFCIIFIMFFYISSFLQDLSQIKYGYYLFIINTIAILVLSKKLHNDIL